MALKVPMIDTATAIAGISVARSRREQEDDQSHQQDGDDESRLGLVQATREWSCCGRRLECQIDIARQGRLRGCGSSALIRSTVSMMFGPAAARHIDERPTGSPCTSASLRRSSTESTTSATPRDARHCHCDRRRPAIDNRSPASPDHWRRSGNVRSLSTIRPLGCWRWPTPEPREHPRGRRHI